MPEPGPYRTKPASTNRELWGEAAELFSTCMELPEVERESLLGAMSRDRPDVVQCVRELLENHQTDFLERPALDGLSDSGGQEAVTVERARSSKPAFFWFSLLANGAALALYVFAIVLIVRYGRLTVDCGWDVRVLASGLPVLEVSPSGAATGELVTGDVLTAINGDADVRGLGFLAAMRRVQPGGRYTVRVLRSGKPIEVGLTNAIVADGSRYGDFACFFAASLSFYWTALLFSALKPTSRLARFAWVALLAEALVVLRAAIGPYSDFLHGVWFECYRMLLGVDGIHFALAYHFYCVFFDELGGVNRRSRMLPVLYSWAFLVSISHVFFEGGLLTFQDQPLAVWLVNELAIAFYFVASVSLCILIAFNYAAVRSPEGKRRARWIVLGSLAGILPYTVLRLMIFVSLNTGKWLSDDIIRVAFRFCILSAISIPLTTAYAILKHRAFDIHVVIRRGLQYMMLKRVLQAILILPALGLLVSLIRNSQTTVADALWRNGFSIALIVLLSGMLRFRLPLERWLDTRFFREAYDREATLLALIRGVRDLSSLEEVARTAGEEIGKALHPSGFAILLMEERGESLKTVYQSEASAPRIRLSARSLILPALEGHGEGRYFSAIRDAVSDASEVDRLTMLGYELVIPLTATAGNAVGLLLLGPKLSDEVYTVQDRRLLGALAGQMAIVYENDALQRRLRDERMVSREIESRQDSKRAVAFRECVRCGRCFDGAEIKCQDDGSDVVLSLPISRVLADRYRLDRLIGKGGMGAVYQAQDLTLSRLVAIKIILESRQQGVNWLKRVYREAKAAARLNHPNIIATYDFGLSEAGVAYLVMEYAAGETLRSELGKGPIAPAKAAGWFDQMLDGVEAAHRAGIVHRDLKPENVLIVGHARGGGVVKILDFGIAKLSCESPEVSELTVPGTVMGSIQYMSPEQVYGGAADERSDIFAVGVMMFEALTGRLPFSGNTYTERIISLMQGSLALPGRGTANVLLNEALEKCLAKDPERRFRSAAECREAIVPLIAQYSGAGAGARATIAGG